MIVCARVIVSLPTFQRFQCITLHLWWPFEFLKVTEVRNVTYLKTYIVSQVKERKPSIKNTYLSMVYIHINMFCLKNAYSYELDGIIKTCQFKIYPRANIGNILSPGPRWNTIKVLTIIWGCATNQIKVWLVLCAFILFVLILYM